MKVHPDWYTKPKTQHNSANWVRGKQGSNPQPAGQDERIAIYRERYLAGEPLFDEPIPEELRMETE